jgi:hypothetical protein
METERRKDDKGVQTQGCLRQDARERAKHDPRQDEKGQRIIFLPSDIAIQRGAVVFVWPSGFLEARDSKAEKPYIFQEKTSLLAFPPSSERPTNSMFLNKYCFLASVPQASETPLGPKITTGSL